MYINKTYRIETTGGVSAGTMALGELTLGGIARISGGLWRAGGSGYTAILSNHTGEEGQEGEERGG